MRLLFFNLFILSFYSSISQESNNKIVGIWTVSDAGITAHTFCGSFDFSKTIGTKYEFFDSGRLKIRLLEREISDQRFENLKWNFSSENTITIKSADGKIDFGKIKFYFYNHKLYLDNNVVGMVLEKK